MIFNENLPSEYFAQILINLYFFLNHGIKNCRVAAYPAVSYDSI